MSFLFSQNPYRPFHLKLFSKFISCRKTSAAKPLYYHHSIIPYPFSITIFCLKCILLYLFWPKLWTDILLKPSIYIMTKGLSIVWFQANHLTWMTQTSPSKTLENHNLSSNGSGKNKWESKYTLLRTKIITNWNLNYSWFRIVIY